MDENTPIRKAMDYYFQPERTAARFPGGKRATIVTTINRDIKRTKEKFPHFELQPLKTAMNLRNIRVKATDRNQWKRRVKMITDAAHSNRATLL